MAVLPSLSLENLDMFRCRLSPSPDWIICLTSTSQFPKFKLGNVQNIPLHYLPKFIFSRLFLPLIIVSHQCSPLTAQTLRFTFLSKCLNQTCCVNLQVVKCLLIDCANFHANPSQYSHHKTTQLSMWEVIKFLRFYMTTI